MVICLERGADLHMAQLMPLPLAVSCSSKIKIGFTFLVPARPGSPGQMAVKRVCDAWPVRRQTYGYLPSRRASPLLDRYQVILLGDRSERVCEQLALATCILT